ncbi:unnamed protein product [Thlaspi arvense]|uniref:DUF7812 domain-containing protein n=1 Tax=Thlaspi arvense TaxID=13288 RepID=A0AAU9S7R1_THLAR|nr:unnamed protein product [Thlaspi arvense]
MTAKRNRKKPCKVSDPVSLFRSLASAIASAQVSKQPILRRLLYILGQLSLTQPISWEVASHYWNIEQVELIKFDDVCNLSDALFTELDTSFENIFSTLLKGNAETCPTSAAVELAILFLRCCVKIVTLLLPRQDLVFMNEILVNKSVRDVLFLVDSASSSCRLFSKHDRAGVVEMVSAHFIISASDEKTNRMCAERLCCDAFTPTQISLCAAMSLLQNPVISSAPRMIHAYVVLLVSDAIGACSPPCVKGPDLQFIDSYIDAFEKSVALYTMNMCKGENAPSGRVAFEHLLLPSTLEKVKRLTLKLEESWGAYQSDSAKRENNELVANSVAYAKASLCVFDSSCSESMLSQTLSILGGMILRASSDDVVDSVLQKHKASNMEDLYLLASTLKLMSYSMLQAIRVLRNCNWHQSEAVGDVRACKEYKAMMDVVQRFEQLSVHLPGQSFLRDRNAKSKWMLMHFSGLLSVSYALKLDFLMKNSIFGMVVSLYLLILEGGDLEALKNSVCHSESPSSSSIPSSGSKDLEASCNAEETAVDRKSSGAVALKFQKIRTLYLGKMSEAKDAENCGVGVEEESCNGEKFLWCVAGKGKMKSSDVEELADFIACEPGKDYSDWLKGRERFRNQRWKSEKIALQRWNRKQKAWRESKRKSS